MLNTLIIGASGYAGAELTAYLHRHPQINIAGLMVSAQSADADKLFSDLHLKFKGIIDLPLQPLVDVVQATKNIDVVFFATAHEVSHDLAPEFLAVGCVVFDLSGAWRVQDPDFYPQYYGIEHQHVQWLSQAVYGLAEWQTERIKRAQLIALPGCYPTVSQLALKPLIDKQLLNEYQWPVINAVSGASGAGRNATMNNSFCEVSLQPYGLFTHRHQPEITTHLGVPVVFIPHMGNFARGILATITCRLKSSVTSKDVAEVYRQAYHHKPLVRLYKHGIPALKDVVGLPFCDIGFSLQGEHLIVVATVDNLLKGAAAQAVQCMNIRFGFQEIQAIL